jgi:hypothetical protein
MPLETASGLVVQGIRNQLLTLNLHRASHCVFNGQCLCRESDLRPRHRVEWNSEPPQAKVDDCRVVAASLRTFGKAAHLAYLRSAKQLGK